MTTLLQARGHWICQAAGLRHLALSLSHQDAQDDPL